MLVAQGGIFPLDVGGKYAAGEVRLLIRAMREVIVGELVPYFFDGVSGRSAGGSGGIQRAPHRFRNFTWLRPNGDRRQNQEPT